MADYEYMIGLTWGGMQNVEDLSTRVPAPKSSYRDYYKAVTRGDGATLGVGAPVATWHWGFLTAQQRDQLKSFVIGASGYVWINTRKNEYDPNHPDEYQVFYALMAWPLEEEKDAGRRLDLTIEFRLLVASSSSSSSSSSTSSSSSSSSTSSSSSAP